MTRARLLIGSLLACLAVLAGCTGPSLPVPGFGQAAAPEAVSGAPAPVAATGAAADALKALPVAQPGSMTGYARTAFLPTGWADTDHNGCDQRNDVLRRDLKDTLPATGCVVKSGTLDDPYTGHVEQFTKAKATAVQIDHVVALGDAWISGASAWTPQQREKFATDEQHELLAVDGPANERKGDKDVSRWIPPNTAFQCTYVAKQIEVKTIYKLTTTVAEHATMAGVLQRCPGQAMP
jgi:hypothetical protein